MKALLDTCVVSEWIKPRPHKCVERWLNSQTEDQLYLSVLTAAEIMRGTLNLPAGRKRDRLTNWLHRDLMVRFAGRTLDVNLIVAEQWAAIQMRCAQIRYAIPAVDGLIAATALAYDLTIVTRNESDFRASGAPIFNPWKD